MTLTRRTFCASTILSPVAFCDPRRLQAIAPGVNPSTKNLRQPQLFLDDTWIEQTQRLARVWINAEIAPEPVLRPEMPWEGKQLVMFGSVFRLANEWRMYYMTYNRPAPSLLCMAVSDDGLRWERPKLGLTEYRGSKDNNILWMPAPGETQDGPTVCHDPHDTKAPFKMMYFGGGKKVEGEYVGFSTDGIRWRHHPEPVLTSSGDRTNLLPGRDKNGKFVAWLRHKDMMKIYGARTIWRSESDDFLRWSEPEAILLPDLLDDADTELYGMAAFQYSDMYIGMLERWLGNPDVIEVQLAWSHDGVQWLRPAVRRPFIGPTFPWNKGWSSCASTAPVRVGNQLWFYFGGRSGAHGREVPGSYGAVGLATLTVDRFAAVSAGFKDGLLLTKPMTWPGGDLVLNCTNSRFPKGHPNSGGGIIAVEVRDPANQPVSGFSGEQRASHNVVSPTAFSTRERPVKWPGGRSLNELAGRQIRLAFFLRDARLFSFRASAA